MFSLHLAEPQARQSRRAGLAERLLGKALGFAAGLALVLAVDALALQGQLLRGVSESFALNQPALSHAARSVWASAVGR